MSGYIGTQPVPQATQTRDSFTATSGQVSFSCSGYTPNFLDVFLNGVKLAAADYTATNGSDVVLASGASTGDILEVVAFTTFTPADIPAGTPSIDDNGNATALTIDSSENIMIGTTSQFGSAITCIDAGDSKNGLAINQDHAGGGFTPVLIDRTASDGTLIAFDRNGTSVGSIAASGGDLLIGTGDTGIRFVDAENTLVPFNTNGSGRDNAISLGKSVERFKDLYLSGGVYLGGTGSANKLEDYESGTWNPTYTSSSTDPTFSPNLQNGEYTKIGRMVYASFRLRGAISGTKTGNLRLSGLPFTANSSPATGSGSIGLTENFGADNYPTNLRVNQSATYINLMVYDNADPRDGLFTNVTVTSTSGSSSGNYIIGHVVYQTDS